jgi:EAL domain-containing protein (putative c-di-GMP-specific phosphodiesterase class I)
MKEAIQGLLAEQPSGPMGQGLYTLFQPIIDAATREPIGYEALTRGPEGPLELPAALITAAATAAVPVCLPREIGSLTW